MKLEKDIIGKIMTAIPFLKKEKLKKVEERIKEEFRHRKLIEELCK